MRIALVGGAGAMGRGTVADLAAACCERLETVEAMLPAPVLRRARPPRLTGVLHDGGAASPLDA